MTSLSCYHKTLGAGLLESVYETCFCYELQKRGIKFERQVSAPIIYDGYRLDETLRLDVDVKGLGISNKKLRVFVTWWLEF
jgi:GxxExxY protein